MKKLLQITTAIVLLVFTSCSNEENEEASWIGEQLIEELSSVNSDEEIYKVKYDQVDSEDSESSYGMERDGELQRGMFDPDPARWPLYVVDTRIDENGNKSSTFGELIRLHDDDIIYSYRTKSSEESAADDMSIDVT